MTDEERDALLEAVRYERQKVADMMAQRDAARALADELAYALRDVQRLDEYEDEYDPRCWCDDPWTVGGTSDHALWCLTACAALAKWEASK